MKSFIAFACTISVLAGCATLSPEQSFSPVASLAKTHFNAELARNPAPDISARVNALLAAPLTAEGAMQIALLNNRGLQAAFAELGVAEADYADAGRMPNPGFTFARLKRGEEIEIDRGLHFAVGSLLTLPLRSSMEARRFAETQARLQIDVVNLAVAARKAYFHALAASETVRYRRQVKEVADMSATLAQRMRDAGNWSKLAELRQQGFQSDADVSVTRAELDAVRSREKLARLLGVESVRITLPERLPDLPDAPRAAREIDEAALTQRLDIAAQKRALEATAANLGLVRRTRFINAFEIGPVHNSANFEAPQRGYEIAIEIPLWNWGDAKVARAEATYLAAAHRVAQTGMEALSEVREAQAAYRASYDIARKYREEIVPAKKRIAEESLKRYNGMLSGVFDLLADARAQITSVNTGIDALRDFWLADADLQMAMLTKPASNAAPAAGNMAGAENASAH